MPRLLPILLVTLVLAIVSTEALALACGTISTYSDHFDNVAYNGNNGTQNWSSDWGEIGDDNDPDEGDIKIKDDISNYQLKLSVKNNTAIGIERSLNLGGFGNDAEASLSFDYRQADFLRGNDFFDIEISTDSGNTWQQIARLSGPASSNNYQNITLDISAYLASNSRIRIISSSDYDEDYKLYIDNLTVTVIDLTGCPALPATHYAIAHDGLAQTCQNENITISRHDELERIASPTFTGTMTLATSSNHGDWSLVTGSGTLQNQGNGLASYQWSASDPGEITVALNTSVRETLNINISDGSLQEASSEDPDLAVNFPRIQAIQDNFNAIAFNGSDGSHPWLTDWAEINDDNDPDQGDVRVKEDNTPYALRISGKSQRTIARGIWRSFNLGNLSNTALASLDFDYRRAKIKQSGDHILIEISDDGGNLWHELGRIEGVVEEDNYRHAHFDISQYMAADTRIRFLSSSQYDEDSKVYIDNLLIEVTDDVGCAANKASHFVLSHDQQGIYCLAEVIHLSAKKSNGQTDGSYGGLVTLDTGTGTGSWTLLSGQGQFTDTTSGDGLATYQFNTTDNGNAYFSLSYPSGPASININSYDGTIQDDNSEGLLTFSASGLLMTASAISNPPPAAIDTAIPAQLSASPFSLYLTAFGQDASHPQCGVIETYDGQKDLQFWSRYDNPASGTISVNINNSSIATSAALASSQSITFNQGQAQITSDYADVGIIGLSAKDTHSGILGSSQGIVIKPATLTVTNIVGSADNTPNPAATDANGAAFIAAGLPFTATVSARNANGQLTPNFGQEIIPESVLLTATLLAPAGGHNPSISAATGFTGLFSNGIATGTDFIWPEVGVIAVNASIADADYLGGGNVSGPASAAIGRFTPHHFTVAETTTASLQSQCGTFSYLEQAIPYAVAPAVVVTARAFGEQITENYQGSWWKLADFSASYSHQGTLSTALSLDSSAATHSPLSCPGCAGSGQSQFSGTLTYRRSQLAIDPFIAAVNIAFNITDSDGISYSGNPFTISAIGFDQGAEVRSGKGYARNAFGTYAQINDQLAITAGSQYYDSIAGGWINNIADSCTAISYNRSDNGINSQSLPASPVTLNAGSRDILLTLTADTGNPGGSSTLSLGWPSWLPGPSSVTASFGLFRGDDRRLNWRESH